MHRDLDQADTFPANYIGQANLALSVRDTKCPAEIKIPTSGILSEKQHTNAHF